MIIKPFISILRLSNALMASGAVLLGYWISQADHGIVAPGLLALAAALSTGFGNVVNDIIDLESDRINHPARPLPRGEITRVAAGVYAGVLVVLALLLSVSVSVVHAAATLFPLIILTVYALVLKQTPLAGNIVVATLVAYALIFGGIGGERLSVLIAPAGLAFLLNICREIVKDLQDAEGDLKLGITTSAVLPLWLLRSLVYGAAVVWVPLLVYPWVKGMMGLPYLLISILVAVPIHLIWIVKFQKATTPAHFHRVSLLLKFEMVCGLFAICADQLVRTFF